MIGPESIRAAEAAMCANDQGQFWPYHDLLYDNQGGENQGAFADDKLKSFAITLGLDETAFNDCLDSGRYEDAVRAETVAGQARGVGSTPTLFINGEKVEGALPFSQLRQLVEIALTDAQTG